jgi:hypothetical protein
MSQERPWWASDPRVGGDGGPGARDEHPAGANRPQHGDGAVCQVCPICAFLRVVKDARPEAMEHLLEAAHHLTLAAKSVVEAYAEGADRSDRLERIPLDDD